MKGYILPLALILSLSFVMAASYDLERYPIPFVVNGIFNAKIIVGQNAATSDVIGAIDIAASLIAESQTDIQIGRISSLFDSHIGMLDVDAPELGAENLIVVGGPCANAVAAELLGYPMPCNDGFEFGKAMIRYFPEQKALLVAGYEAQETLAASYIIADYKDYDLSGDEMEVTIAGQDILALNPVVI
ncbi:hypothetical protein ACFL1B_00420 [Nanoarchaeota archaeon]